VARWPKELERQVEFLWSDGDQLERRDAIFILVDNINGSPLGPPLLSQAAVSKHALLADCVQESTDLATRIARSADLVVVAMLGSVQAEIVDFSPGREVTLQDVGRELLTY
jgi:hypothetical protein